MVKKKKKASDHFYLRVSVCIKLIFVPGAALRQLSCKLTLCGGPERRVTRQRGGGVWLLALLSLPATHRCLPHSLFQRCPHSTTNVTYLLIPVPMLPLPPPFTPHCTDCLSTFSLPLSHPAVLHPYFTLPSSCHRPAHTLSSISPQFHLTPSLVCPFRVVSLFPPHPLPPSSSIPTWPSANNVGTFSGRLRILHVAAWLGSRRSTLNIFSPFLLFTF